MKKSFILLIFLSLLIASCAGTKYKNQKTNTSTSTRYSKQVSSVKKDTKTKQVNLSKDKKSDRTRGTSFALADNIINTAVDNLGVKYKYGGTTKSGFDCSGLVYSSFGKFDISLPRTSYEMAEFGKKIKDSEVQKGDLVFFITNGGRRINHVGIVTEVNNGEIKFVHASTKAGVVISSTKEPYYKKNYVKAARVL
ncbi:MAG: C40 family peptidase [Flavobacteriaceae bacterium]